MPNIAGTIEKLVPTQAGPAEPLPPIKNLDGEAASGGSASAPMHPQPIQEASQESTIATRIMKRKIGQKAEEAPEPKRPKAAPKPKGKQVRKT